MTRDAHDDLVARTGLGQLGDERMPVVVPLADFFDRHNREQATRRAVKRLNALGYFRNGTRCDRMRASSTFASTFAFVLFARSPSRSARVPCPYKSQTCSPVARCRNGCQPLSAVTAAILEKRLSVHVRKENRGSSLMSLITL